MVDPWVPGFADETQEDLLTISECQEGEKAYLRCSRSIIISLPAAAQTGELSKNVKAVCAVEWSWRKLFWRMCG